jgi:hypothetical protein
MVNVFHVVVILIEFKMGMGLTEEILELIDRGIVIDQLVMNAGEVQRHFDMEIRQGSGQLANVFKYDMVPIGR